MYLIALLLVVGCEETWYAPPPIVTIHPLLSTLSTQIALENESTLIQSQTRASHKTFSLDIKQALKRMNITHSSSTSHLFEPVATPHRPSTRERVHALKTEDAIVRAKIKRKREGGRVGHSWKRRYRRHRILIRFASRLSHFLLETNEQVLTSSAAILTLWECDGVALLESYIPSSSNLYLAPLNDNEVRVISQYLQKKEADAQSAMRKEALIRSGATLYHAVDFSLLAQENRTAWRCGKRIGHRLMYITARCGKNGFFFRLVDVVDRKLRFPVISTIEQALLYSNPPKINFESMQLALSLRDVELLFRIRLDKDAQNELAVIDWSSLFKDLIARIQLSAVHSDQDFSLCLWIDTSILKKGIKVPIKRSESETIEGFVYMFFNVFVSDEKLCFDAYDPVGCVQVMTFIVPKQKLPSLEWIDELIHVR